MDKPTDEKAPTWFWVVSGLALAWSLMGVAAYLMQVTMSPAEIAAYPQAQRELFAATPPWVTGAFAFAVFGGTLGAIALLLRRKWAQPLMLISLVAAIAQFGWTFLIAKAHQTIGPSSVPFPLLIILIGVALVWYARMAARKGWLR